VLLSRCQSCSLGQAVPVRTPNSIKDTDSSRGSQGDQQSCQTASASASASCSVLPAVLGPIW